MHQANTAPPSECPMHQSNTAPPSECPMHVGGSISTNSDIDPTNMVSFRPTIYGLGVVRTRVPILEYASSSDLICEVSMKLCPSHLFTDF